MASDPSLFLLFGCSIFNASIFYLFVEVESDSPLSLGFLHPNPNCRHPGDPDAAASGSQHSDGEPTTDIPECKKVGLPPLFGEAYGQALQRRPRLCAHNTVN